MARKRFKPKPIELGSGQLNASHKVELASGKYMTVKVNKTKPVKGERSAPISKSKKAILNRLPQQEAKFRQLMRSVIKEFEQELAKSDNPSKRRLDGQLRSPEVKRLRKKLDELMSKTVKQMRDSLIQNVQASVKTYLIGLNQASSEKLGTRKDLSARAESMAKELYRERIGGATASERIAVLAGKLDAQLRGMVGLDKKQRLLVRDQLISKVIAPKREGESCVSRGFSRLNRTEQSRGIQKASIRLLKSAKVELAYWRLSPSHKDYGGSEICEVLATSTGIGVLDELAKRQSSLSEIGLYTVEDFPLIPHANCMCSIEPVF